MTPTGEGRPRDAPGEVVGHYQASIRLLLGCLKLRGSLQVWVPSLGLSGRCRQPQRNGKTCRAGPAVQRWRVVRSR